MSPLQLVGLASTIISVAMYAGSYNEWIAGNTKTSVICNAFAVVLGVVAVVIGILT